MRKTIAPNAIAICISDPNGKRPCILDDPNKCRHTLYSECLEENGKGRHRTGQVPLPTNPSLTPAQAAAPAPPASDPNQEKTPYDASLEIIGKNGAIDFTFPNLDFDLLTTALKDLIKQENTNSKNFTHALVIGKEKFFSEKGKKKGWKGYIEKTIGYSYRQVQNQIKGYQNPLIQEYWEGLGIAKIGLLNRFKGPLNQELIEKVISLSVSEVKKNLFPRLTPSIFGTDKLISQLENLDLKGLKAQVRRKLKEVLKRVMRELSK